MNDVLKIGLGYFNSGRYRSPFLGIGKVTPGLLRGSIALIMCYSLTGNAMTADKQILPDTVGFHDVRLKTSVGEVDITLLLPAEMHKDTPLILVLHYAGQPTRFYGRPLLENLVAPSFAGLDAIFVAPTSVGGDWQTASNITAVFEIMDMLENHYDTDKERRAVTGYSMGAIGSWLIQSQRPGYFSAAIPIAGYPTRSSVDCETPSYAIMSDQDEIFALQPFERLIEELQQKKCPVKAEIISGAGHYDIGSFQQALTNAVIWLRETWK